MAAQDIWLPLCCTLFTKPNTPLGGGDSALGVGFLGHGVWKGAKLLRREVPGEQGLGEWVLEGAEFPAGVGQQALCGRGLRKEVGFAGGRGSRR